MTRKRVSLCRFQYFSSANKFNVLFVNYALYQQRGLAQPAKCICAAPTYS